MRPTEEQLMRAATLVAARAKLGEMATISSDDRLPRLVWVIGFFDRSVGKGRTWEEALARSRPVPVRKVEEQ